MARAGDARGWGELVAEKAERRPDGGRRRWVVGIGALYLVALGFVVLWPTRISEPFARLLERLENRSPGSVADLEFVANILLFVPAGFLLAVLLGPARRWRAAGIAMAASVAIELAQGILLPARLASLSDIIANSVGAVLGVLVAGRTVGAAPDRRRRAVG